MMSLSAFPKKDGGVKTISENDFSENAANR
jgi:hypothetical protein